MFTEAQIQRMLDATSLQHIHNLDSVGSTNDVARSLCAESELILPCLVIARDQTRGRGRGQSAWVGGAGALTISLIHEMHLRQQGLGPARYDQSLVSLWTALGVRAALAEVADGRADTCFQVKWPNDIYAGDRKIGGILIETVTQPTARRITGIGVNVNNQAPILKDKPVRTVAMQDLLGQPTEIFGVLLRIVQRLDAMPAEPTVRLRSAWEPHCYLRGRHVRTNEADGLCEGISDDGALCVQTGRGLVKVRSGSVAVQPPRQR